MRRSITQLVSTVSHRRSSGLAAVVLCACALGVASSAAASSVPNVCRITGITKAVARSVFPKFQGPSNVPNAAQTTPPNLGATCDIAPNVAGASALEVELWSATVFSQQVLAFKGSGHVQHLHHLGAGAVWEPDKLLHDEANVVFRRGKYTVLIGPGSIGGSEAEYPTEAQYIKLADAIFHHLR
jgi:hypothetical protein